MFSPTLDQMIPDDHSTFCGFRTSFGREQQERQEQAPPAADDSKAAKKVQVPLADPEAPIGPNKEGGFAWVSLDELLPAME